MKAVAQSPPAGSAAPLYFVYYSRDERDLAGKIEAKLGARRRRGEIDLWRDVRNLDVWEEFTPEIQRVLASAAAAIIIMSDSWYVSTYIQEHEWPTVLARASEPGFGVFLLAVHDLDSDDPLRLRTFVNDLREELLVAADDATRDRVLTRLSDLVGRHARTVSAAAGPGDGDLHAVPDDRGPVPPLPRRGRPVDRHRTQARTQARAVARRASHKWAATSGSSRSASATRVAVAIR